MAKKENKTLKKADVLKKIYEKGIIFGIEKRCMTKYENLKAIMGMVT